MTKFNKNSIHTQYLVSGFFGVGQLPDPLNPPQQPPEKATVATFPIVVIHSMAEPLLKTVLDSIYSGAFVLVNLPLIL